MTILESTPGFRRQALTTLGLTALALTTLVPLLVEQPPVRFVAPGNVSVQWFGLFLPPQRAALTLLPFVALYPISIAYYYGQLTDPLSHTLFILGFLYIMEERPFALAASLALGMLAKETAVLLVLCFAVCSLVQ